MFYSPSVGEVFVHVQYIYGNEFILLLLILMKTEVVVLDISNGRQLLNAIGEIPMLLFNSSCKLFNDVKDFNSSLSGNVTTFSFS